MPVDPYWAELLDDCRAKRARIVPASAMDFYVVDALGATEDALFELIDGADFNAATETMNSRFEAAAIRHGVKDRL